LMTKNWKKYSWIFFSFFDKKLNLKLISKPHTLRTSKLQEKPSALKGEHPALQKMKFINCFLFFSGPFLPSW
jgi:hypothetical protein